MSEKEVTLILKGPCFLTNWYTSNIEQVKAFPSKNSWPHVLWTVLFSLAQQLQILKPNWHLNCKVLGVVQAKEWGENTHEHIKWISIDIRRPYLRTHVWLLPSKVPKPEIGITHYNMKWNLTHMVTTTSIRVEKNMLLTLVEPMPTWTPQFHTFRELSTICEHIYNMYILVLQFYYCEW